MRTLPTLRVALAFLLQARHAVGRPLIYVRINALDTGLSEGDLDTVMTALPDGVLVHG